MPWHTEQGGGDCAADQWAVIKDSDGSTAGCHDTKAEAEAQVAALYANEPGAKMSDQHELRAAVDNSEWDGNAAMTACTSAADYRAVCAGRREGDPSLRSTWALPHHQRPGSPPNAAGVRNSLSRLPQTQGLVNKQEAQRHLDAHMATIQAQASTATGPEQIRQLREGTVPAGAARSLAFPSRLRAERVERDGIDYVHISGIASAYEQLYEMWDIAGPYKEGVRSGAGAVSLAKPPDVALLTNHRGITMARTVNERRPMELREIPEGLQVDAWVNPTRSDVRDTVTAINDGDLTEMSFAFMIRRGTWNDDFTEYWIEEFDIDRGDVSVVTYGANPYTSVAARSREIMAELDQLPTGAARAAYQRLATREDVAAIKPEPQPEPAGVSVNLVRARLELLKRNPI